MLKSLERILIGFAITFWLFIWNPYIAIASLLPGQIAQTDPTELAKAVAEIENLDTMLWVSCYFKRFHY